MVRILFFDKPPEWNWALPWHQDTTIAVAEHRPSERFTKPTVKSGVPHVEAPTGLLERMLSARLHLDPMDDENGPLRVRIGSHLGGKELREGGEWTVHAAAGDVLLMRPLLAHSSKKSLPGTTRHRRILHFEFAADPTPGDGFAWRQFHPLPATGL
jgi:ectoine hydroxylase-related dioxygenase (phytanoyl-CoA dioxygenase family)